MAAPCGEADLVGAIDQGTSSSRFLVFEAGCLSKAAYEHTELVNHDISGGEGYFDQDPGELLSSVEVCLGTVWKGMGEGARGRLRAIGVTNQRETLVVWDRASGRPLYRTIGWNDARNSGTVQKLIRKFSKLHFKEQTGLPINTYFTAVKLLWLMEHEPAVCSAVYKRTCYVGTVDTWIIWNLTGGVKGGVYVTDVTNASRTMLMNIHSCQWDPDICRDFNIPIDILPEIKSSSEMYGEIAEGVWKGVPICGCLGDQQAALVGQRCFGSGQTKNTYGSGCFLLCNTGQKPIESDRLLTTVAYQLGPQQRPKYALEGGVAGAGLAVEWLKNELKFFKGDEESDKHPIETRAKLVPNTGGVYFVPAFSGLFAPHWESDATGLLIGLSNHSNKNHICRATLEAVCFQSREILDAMTEDSGHYLEQLWVDGKMTRNKTLMQLQADLLQKPVACPSFQEMTALGAAIAAGLAVGVWRGTEELPKGDPPTLLHPSIPPDECERRYKQWKRAVERCRRWHSNDLSLDPGPESSATPLSS